MEKKRIDCKIVKMYGVISETDTMEKILAEISWNGRAAKLEIRNRNKETGDVLKGIALSIEEIATLYNLISSEHVIAKMDMFDAERDHIDLEDVLTNVHVIREIRKTHATKDGLILLNRKNIIDLTLNGDMDIRSYDRFER